MRTLLPLAMVLLPSRVHASGLSTDISVSPVTAAGVSVGPIQLTSVATPGSLRVGWAADYTHRPMDQYRCSGPELNDCSDVVGTVIGERIVGVVALGVALSHRTWIEAAVPAAAQWRGSVDTLSPDGVALGDPRIGLRTRFVDGPVSLDGYGEVSLPLGQRGVWFSDTLPTAHVGAVGTATSGPVTGLIDVAGWLRQSPDLNPWDFRLGSAVLADAGVMVAVSSQTSLWAVVQSRFTGGPPAVVAMVGVAADLSPELRVDVGVGRALAFAPGAGPIHGRLTVTYSLARAPRIPPDLSAAAPLQQPAPDAWAAGQTVRLRDGHIELRDAIAFRPGSTTPSPRSYPTIVALAEWLTDDAPVEHLLLATYASSQSTSAANYSLSLTRAQALADALVTAGVPRSRLSYKGMGMLAPDADSGTHQVVVNGETVPHTTLNITDRIDDEASDGEPSFDAWFATHRAGTP